MKNDPLLSIGSISQRTGAAVSAIRFYASKALVPSVRSSSGHRLFYRSSIRRISFILICQNLGYSLNEIKLALEELPQERTPTKKDWDRLGRQFSKDIDKKIKELSNLKETLSGCIGCGCLSLQKCRLYNPEDKIRKFGAGPRYLMGQNYKDN